MDCFSTSNVYCSKLIINHFLYSIKLFYIDDKIEQLLIKLDDFEKILSHSENNVITKEEFESSSIMQCLIDLKLCEPTDMFVSLIPKSILVCQYVHFRMTLRK